MEKKGSAGSDDLSTNGELLVGCWPNSGRRSAKIVLLMLLGSTIPEKPSPLYLSGLLRGVGAGSTDTTDLIGKTRSVADGLNWSKGESELGDMEDSTPGVPCLDLEDESGSCAFQRRSLEKRDGGMLGCSERGFERADSCLLGAGKPGGSSLS